MSRDIELNCKPVSRSYFDFSRRFELVEPVA